MHMPKIKTNDKCTWVGLNMVLFFISTSYLGICTLIILGIINFRGATNFRETQIILLIHSYPISYPLVPPLNSQCGWGPETSNLWTNPNSKFYLNCWSHHIPRYSYRVTPTCLLLCQAKSQFQENEIGIPTLFIFNFAFSPFFSSNNDNLEDLNGIGITAIPQSLPARLSWITPW